ncbi:hypothetical protein L596_027122 [Steinernema carpocapsae]|uniref:Uncharacterized protein n=1 Tax=Steinernema carpocapsae TaxID=34508 RepID=A0A4U5M3D8_STECR|nr:hypothetical protein L596_027122 [Steinernema carpocapsae]
MLILCSVLLLATLPVAYSDEPIYILPVLGTPNWKFSLTIFDGKNGNGYHIMRTLTNLSLFPTDTLITGIHFESIPDEWVTVTPDFAKNQLVPFISQHLSPTPSLSLPGRLSTELRPISDTLLHGLIGHKFTSISLGYYGQVSENFVASQVDSGRLESVELLGSWPESINNLVKTYLSRDFPARLNFDKSGGARIKIDQELFALLFDKFLKNALFLTSMTGDLAFRPKNFFRVRPDLQTIGIVSPRTAGNDVYAWKSPTQERFYFVIEFANRGVELYTFYKPVVSVQQSGQA